MLQEEKEQTLENIYKIKDTYSESEIPTNETKNIKFLIDIESLYNQLPKLDEAIDSLNQDCINEYFKKYAEKIQEIEFDENEPHDFIEFIFPYMLDLTRKDMPQKILMGVLLAIAHLVNLSHYYALKFYNSPAYQQLQTIVRSNLSDYITGISINIFIYLSDYDDLSDTYRSTFSLQEIADRFNSEENTKYVKEGFLLLIEKYVNDASDEEEASQIFNYLLEILLDQDLDIIFITQTLCIISRYCQKNDENGIDFLPENIADLISSRIIDILSGITDDSSNEIFFLVYYFSNNNIHLNFPVEGLYQLILSDKISSHIKNNIVTMMANSIKLKDDIEYSKIFITESLVKAIEFCLNEGTLGSQVNSLYLLGCIFVTDNFELFLLILDSIAFQNLINLIEDIEDETVIFLSIGLLGNAFHQFQTEMPDSKEFQLFLHKIIDSNLLEILDSIIEHNSIHSELYMSFTSLIQSEAWRLSED